MNLRYREKIRDLDREFRYQSPSDSVAPTYPTIVILSRHVVSKSLISCKSITTIKTRDNEGVNKKYPSHFVCSSNNIARFNPNSCCCDSSPASGCQTIVAVLFAREINCIHTQSYFISTILYNPRIITDVNFIASKRHVRRGLQQFWVRGRNATMIRFPRYVNVQRVRANDTC